MTAAPAHLHRSATAAEPAWRARVRSHPLESPVALSARWQPLVRSITGRSSARFTTGAATRAALAAAGAIGATTGMTLHLARVPINADRPVVAHELAHSRMALTRPRFLLSHAHGDVDADERTAHSVADTAMQTPRRPDRPAVTRVARTVRTGAPAVNRLPVAGLAGAPAALSGLVTRAASPVVDSRPQALDPTGGSPTTGGLGHHLGGVDQTRQGSGSSEPGQTSVSRQGENVEDGGVAGTSGTGGAVAAAAPLDLDQLVESLENRLIRELERRGGRFADVF